MSGFKCFAFLRLLVNIGFLCVHKQALQVKDSSSSLSLALKTCQRVVIADINISVGSMMQENCHFQAHFSR